MRSRFDDDEADDGAGAENPSLGLFENPPVSMPESEYYDQWGNLKTPLKVIEETHGENFIKIFVYQYQADYFFGYQIKIDGIIRQKKANIKGLPMRDADEARESARKMIVDICNKKKVTKRIFAEFTIIKYNQPELF